MGEAGRKRTAKLEKIKKGTYRSDRDLKHPLTYEPLTAIPVPNREMNKSEAWFYKYYCTILLSNGLLTAAYIGDIQAAAQWHSIKEEAWGQLEKKDGKVYKASTGYTQPTAWITVYEKANKYLTDFYSRYGFTLVSKEKIDMKPPDEPDDLDRI